MEKLISFKEWKVVNELRILPTSFRIADGHHWQEYHRESIQTQSENQSREIGVISFGIASTPSLNRFYVIINIETEPISGWGSHQIMTVHQSEHEDQESAIKALENHWNTLKFKSIETEKGAFPTQSFSSVNKNESIDEAAYKAGKRKPTPEEIEMCKSPEGFNQINHCKALGLIPREDGTKAVSKKYGGNA